MLASQERLKYLRTLIRNLEALRFLIFTAGCIFLGLWFSVESMVLKGFTLCESCSMVKDL